MLNKEQIEANKANPTPTGKASPKKALIKILATEIPIPNPSEARNPEVNKRESTIEWIHRRFGTSKEELRELNVTVNQSCQEVPSQTYEDFKENGANIEVSSGTALWGDEVAIMEADIDTNLNNKTKKKGTPSKKTSSM